LTPPIDQRQNLINPSSHIHQVSDIIKRIYGLGDQQAFRLRKAMKRAYEGAGISLRLAPLDPVPLEYSIAWLTCAFASGQGAVMLGWPGATQDRLPASSPDTRPRCPDGPQGLGEGC
jgi:hypothetical protein